MKMTHIALLASVSTLPLAAQETRELDAHVHGVSTLELAVEHGTVQMNLLSPGMDIVGFEYAASTDADKDAVEAAIRALLSPETVVTLPEAAECRLAEVLVHLHSGDHDHEDDAHEHEHEHEEHGDQDDDDDHDDHGDHDDDDDHEEHGAHSEFHAEYAFDCAHPEMLTSLAFPFFENFPNAQEIEAQYVTETGAGQAEIERDSAELTLD